jgi:hypothetical protein
MAGGAICCLGSTVGGTTGPRMTYKDRRRSAKLKRKPFQNRRRNPKPHQKKEILSDKKPSDHGEGNPAR